MRNAGECLKSPSHSEGKGGAKSFGHNHHRRNTGEAVLVIALIHWKTKPDKSMNVSTFGGRKPSCKRGFRASSPIASQWNL